MYLTVLVASVAVATHVPDVKMYASSFLAGDFTEQETENQQTRLLSSLSPLGEGEEKVVVSWGSSLSPHEGFSTPGARKAKIMELSLKSFDADLRLNRLSFQVGGVDPREVEKVYLFHEGEKIAEAKVYNGYAVFSSITFDVPIGVEGTVFVKADLGDNLSPGERVNFTVKAPSDISLLADGNPYDFGNVFPVKGPYLSIVGVRNR